MGLDIQNMPEFFKKTILRLLKSPDYKPLKLKSLAKRLSVSAEDYPRFKDAFDELKNAGHVVIGSSGVANIQAIPTRLTGTFRANHKGFGFVTPLEPNAQGDLFIPAPNTLNALNGDTVLAAVSRKRLREGEMKYSGQIIEILRRAEDKFAGTLIKKGGIWVVIPDGKALIDPIAVDDVTAKNANINYKVIVQIITFPSEGSLARGVILEVLGRVGQYQAELSSIIHQFHLPGEFAEEQLEQAKSIAKSFDPHSDPKRDDITGKTIVTIDPPDAKDFDDAISIEKDNKGNWVLGIHIADVSNFVAQNSPLDIEAKNRGNSTYLPQMTIPMLPEILSNGICSLQPDQKRFVKSAYITYDKEAKIIKTSFANSLISSTQRLTYLQVDKALKKSKPDSFKPGVLQLLRDMKTLAELIEKRRIANEMLRLDILDTELIVDANNRVIDAEPADNSYPHTIIEMFMVEANEAVASLLNSKKLDFIRRVHPAPDVLNFEVLSRLLKSMGINFPKKAQRGDIQSLLESVKGSPASLAVNLMVLRTFEKAQYSPQNIGHFALASNQYCHFTSPIRRYADLLVHRLLDDHLRNKKDHSIELPTLIEIGKHITYTEQISTDAERELKTVLILQLLSKRIGETIDTVVVGLASFGVFLQCQKFGIEGLVPTEAIGPDKWQYDQKTQSITGTNSGFTLHLGMRIDAKIVSVNVPARQLSLCPAEPLIKPQKTKKLKLSAGKTKKKYVRRQNRRR